MEEIKKQHGRRGKRNEEHTLEAVPLLTIADWLEMKHTLHCTAKHCMRGRQQHQQHEALPSKPESLATHRAPGWCSRLRFSAPVRLLCVRDL